METVFLLKLETSQPGSGEQMVLNADMPKKLSFRLLQSRPQRQWSKIWVQSLSINNSTSEIITYGDDLIAMLDAAHGSLEPGDLVEIERMSAEVTTLRMNGVDLGSYENRGFFEFLLTAWIGPIPPSGRLKSDLLGISNPDLEVAFDDASYSDERSELVAQWAETQAGPDEGDAEIAEVIKTGDQVNTQTDAQASAAVESKAPLEPDTIQSNEQISSAMLSASASNASVQAAGPESAEDLSEGRQRLSVGLLIAIKDYQNAVVKRISQNVIYPRRAATRGIEGSLRLGISINSDGSLNEAYIAESADLELFDRALLRAVEAASPFAPIPEKLGIGTASLAFEAPFEFRLQR